MAEVSAPLGGLEETLGTEGGQVHVVVNRLEGDFSAVDLEDKVGLRARVVLVQGASSGQEGSVWCLDAVCTILVEDEREDGVFTPWDDFVAGELLAIVCEVHERGSLNVFNRDHRVVGKVDGPETVA